MTEIVHLGEYLESAVPRTEHALAIVRAVCAVAEGGRAIADLLAGGALHGDLAALRTDSAHGDEQKELDLRADALLYAALSATPVGVIASEEAEAPVMLDTTGQVAIAIDPLDGSSNIDTNAPVGTIFSLLPLPAGWQADPLSAFLQPGTRQLAAGFLIYGPHTSLVLTVGDGVRTFTLDRRSNVFVLAGKTPRIAPHAREYAINGSNWRHWDDATRHYVAECLHGADGPRGADCNTRWIASMVAEAYRILLRGGVYLYPADSRPGYRRGRLRLLYEASPIAWLIEQAGGAATDGYRRILEIVPRTLHEKTPLVFGAIEEVRRISALRATPPAQPSSALFARRTLFRADAMLQGAPACP